MRQLGHRALSLARGRSGRSGGFTLIELLVVISIIAILSFTVVTNLTSARTKARDAKRTSDMTEISKALQLYIANGNPAAAISAITGTASARFNTLVGSTGPLVANGYIPATASVQDPLNVAPHVYEFKNTTVTAGTFSNYALCAQLENPATGTNWFVDVDGSPSLQANDNACQP